MNFERGRRDLEEPFQEDDKSSPDFSNLQHQVRERTSGPGGGAISRGRQIFAGLLLSSAIRPQDLIDPHPDQETREAWRETEGEEVLAADVVHPIRGEDSSTHQCVDRNATR
ncbi:unnamed protein product [Darwinula stevensoni]|uniref:Uncharacterized protein n=1 Tax=Darwinula stevensoni TaxID=69355 RepID=A0A7R8WXG4_9CRUS|nr:unnamed protein product [Darwinula stevensoni]CAG0878517.1 unnamed protein product [Darwinula stevensoni]